MNYIEQHRARLEHRHYLTTPTNPKHFYNIRPNVLREYVDKYGEDFCIIISCSRTQDAAYVLPFHEFRDFFSTDYLHLGERWKGNVRYDEIDVSAKGMITKTEYVGDYRNAFHLIQEAPTPLPPKPVFDYA